MSGVGWFDAPRCGSLPRGEIHVWSVSLYPLVHRSDLLDDEERARAGRYLHRPSREQFTAARVALRLLMGRYLGIEPRQVRFRNGQTGKPILTGSGVHFNVSHSNGMALIALTRNGEVGVDVEHVRPQPTHVEMATRYFTPGEAAALRRLPPGASEQAFFHIWTRKEAFLKALGLGLSHGLERFEVSVPPDDPARILHIDGDAWAGASWSMTSLEPAPGYVGALAIEGQGHEVRLGRFESLRLA